MVRKGTDAFANGLRAIEISFKRIFCTDVLRVPYLE